VEERNANIELEELFRSKLENSEVIPGDGVRADLMRKVGRKEFLRFNPARFNVYYLGGIVAAAVTAAFILGTLMAGKTSQEIKPVLPDKEVVTTTNPVAAPEINLAGGDNRSQAVIIKEDNTKPSDSALSSRVSRKTVQNSAGADMTEVVPVGRQASPAKSNLIMEKLTGGDVTGYQLQKKTMASFDVSLTAGCMPLKVKFVNRSFAWDSCRWIFGDGGSSTENNPSWIFDDAGEYKVILKVFGPGGSESSATRLLNVYPRPKARFEIEPQAPIIPDDQIRFVNYSMDAVRYRWEFGDGKVSEALEPEHKYSRYGSYNVRLIVWTEHGCTDSLLLTNAFAGSGCYINFPNAFIPNSDGPSGGNYSTKSDEAAQIFHPVTSGVSDYQLRIFSKIGILIFESNDINTGWDGYHKGQLCEAGVYIWKVRGTYKNGESFVKMGDLTLLKK
jgi:PKD repeat protein